MKFDKVIIGLALTGVTLGLLGIILNISFLVYCIISKCCN